MAFLFICLVDTPEGYLEKVKELINKHQTKFATRTLESTPAYVMILWDNIKSRQMVRDLKRSMKEGKVIIGLTEELEWWPESIIPKRYEVHDV